MRRIPALLLIACLVGLAWYSLRLAGTRIYHPDECAELYSARVGAAPSSGAASDAAPGFSLFQKALSLVVGGTGGTSDLYAGARFVMVELFWLNLVLLAVAATGRLSSFEGLLAFCAAATLGPLWNYGFEVRSENLVFSCILLNWCFLRVKPRGLQSYAISGVLVALIAASSFKSLLFALPVVLAAIWHPPESARIPRVKAGLVWLAAAALGFSLPVLFFGKRLHLGSPGFAAFSDVFGTQFSGGKAVIGRLSWQVPLLLAAVTASGLALVSDVRQKQLSPWSWSGLIPEAGMALLGLLTVLFAPIYYPLNVLVFIGFGLVLGFRYFVGVYPRIRATPNLTAASVAVVVFGHLVPFWLAMNHQSLRTNSHQEGLVRSAEEMTDPKLDPVLDPFGLVISRPTLYTRWFKHPRDLAEIIRKNPVLLREILLARPAAVYIPCGEIPGVSDSAGSIIRSRYVPMADDFWVLGTLLDPGGGTFEVLHPGRYRVSTLKGSDLADTYPEGWKSIFEPVDDGKWTGQLDEGSAPEFPVMLAPGKHRAECPSDIRLAVVWMGPKLERARRLGKHERQDLFPDW